MSHKTVQLGVIEGETLDDLWRRAEIAALKPAVENEAIYAYVRPRELSGTFPHPPVPAKIELEMKAYDRFSGGYSRRYRCEFEVELIIPPGSL